jgi:hypothetical protein
MSPFWRRHPFLFCVAAALSLAAVGCTGHLIWGVVTSVVVSSIFMVAVWIRDKALDAKDDEH